MNGSRIAAAIAAAGLVLGTTAVTVPAEGHTTGIHDNCTNLNKKWPHGVGLKNAKDKGGTVKNFYRNNKAYWAAENHNGTLDRDNDWIACEKK